MKDPDVRTFAVTGRPRSVVVDARVLQSSGLGRYLREVLAELFDDRRFGEITLLGDRRELQDYVSRHEAGRRIRLVAYPTGAYSPRVQGAWLCIRRSVRADVAFFPHYDVPIAGLPRRSVITVHDLIHYQVPEAFPWWRRAPGGLLLRRAVGAAARVIVVSEATRRDLCARLPVARGKTAVVPNGVSELFRAPATEAADTNVDRLRPFVLCVGNRKPHKNLAAAVEAIALARPHDPALRLVIAGRRSPHWDDVLRGAEELGVAAAIVDLGEVGDSELRSLYRACEALLFPSLYEGFGLPVIEAMAAGAPVIASDRASIPEVVGGAGILIDPRDPAGMARALGSLRDDPEMRRDLVRRGRERAREFSWERAARATLDILYNVAGESSDASRKR